jgi:Ca2+-binding RTX toxin-like protein
VHDPSLPTLVGRFAYGDFCTGEIRSITPASPVTDDTSSGVHMPFFSMSSFGEDGCGHLYATDENGDVDRFDDAAHPPCVITSPTSVRYDEGDGPVAVDPALQLSDADSTTLSGATVAIGAGFTGAEDQLSFSDQNGITGTYDSGTGVLTLTGDATAADYENALRSVLFVNESLAPTAGTRTLSVRVTDSSSTESPAATRDIEVHSVNSVPTVATSAGATTYTGPAVVVDPGVSVSDADDANLENAHVRIAAARQAGDQLLFTGQNGITGTYDSGTGVLTLTGTATPAAYQDALRSVRFRTTKKLPAPARTLTFRVGDGDDQSATASRKLALAVDSDHDGVVDGSDNCPSTANRGQVDEDGDGRGAACDPLDPSPGACANVRRGTDAADTLFGSPAGDRILGLAGGDLLDGRRGDDCVSGAEGADRLGGGRGHDRLSGGPGDDVLTGGRGADVLLGGHGKDHLFGGGGANEYRAGAGDDRIEAANGVAEDVHCGRGRDRATTDATDRTSGCERLVVRVAR